MQGVGRETNRIGAKSAEPPLDQTIAELAARQHGVVSLTQLTDFGLSPRAANGRVATGRMHRVHRGVYAVGHPRLTLHGKWMAATLACGERAALSHIDAAALWGLRGHAGTLIHVTAETRRRHRPGLLLHCSPLPVQDRAVEDGIPVTSVPRTLLDLAEILDARGLRRAWERAYRQRRLDVEKIEALLARSAGRRGLASLRALLDYDPAPAADAESELELLFLDLVREAGLPVPSLNVLVEGYLVDAHWPEARLVIELDGYEFHSGREEFERDREKLAALRLAGYEFLALTHRQVTKRPRAVAEAVCALLARGERGTESPARPGTESRVNL